MQNNVRSAKMSKHSAMMRIELAMAIEGRQKAFMYQIKVSTQLCIHLRRPDFTGTYDNRIFNRDNGYHVSYFFAWWAG